MAINGQFLNRYIHEAEVGDAVLLHGLNSDHLVIKTVKWAGYVYYDLYDDEYFTLHFEDDTEANSHQIHVVKIFQEY